MHESLSSLCAFPLKELFKKNVSTDARIQESRDPKAPRFDVVRTFPLLFYCKRSPADVTTFLFRTLHSRCQTGSCWIYGGLSCTGIDFSPSTSVFPYHYHSTDPPCSYFIHLLSTVSCWYSSAGIATRYGLDAPGIESRWGRDFPHPSRPALGPPSLVYNGYRVFPGGKAAGEWR